MSDNVLKLGKKIDKLQSENIKLEQQNKSYREDITMIKAMVLATSEDYKTKLLRIGNLADKALESESE